MDEGGKIPVAVDHVIRRGVVVAGAVRVAPESLGGGE